MFEYCSNTSSARTIKTELVTRLVLATYAVPPDLEHVLWLSIIFLASKMGVLVLPEISAVPFNHRYPWPKICQSIASNNGGISDFSGRRQDAREEFPLRSQEATIYAPPLPHCTISPSPSCCGPSFLIHSITLFIRPLISF